MFRGSIVWFFIVLSVCISDVISTTSGPTASATSSIIPVTLSGTTSGPTSRATSGPTSSSTLGPTSSTTSDPTSSTTPVISSSSTQRITSGTSSRTTTGTTLSSVSSSPSVLNLVWMVPFSTHPNTVSYVYNASSSIAALALGLDTIKNLQILTKHEFNVTIIDTGCNRRQALGALVDIMYSMHINVVIGPPCAHVTTAIAELLSYKDIPIINWVSLGQTIDGKGSINTYIRAMAPMSALGGIMTYFYYFTKWTRFVIISSNGDDFAAGAETIANNIKLHEIKGFMIAHHYAGVNRNITSLEIDHMYQTIKHEGRIIILVIPRSELRKYMLRAHALGMTSGDYQFLYTETKLASADDIAIINSNKLWKRGDSNDNAARIAFENVLIFVLGHNTSSTFRWGQSAVNSYQKYFGNKTGVPKLSKLDQYAAYLHDAVVLYGYILSKSLENNQTGRGADIFLFANKVYFKGLSGDVVMNSNGDRQPAFFVYDLNRDGIFHQVSSLLYTISVITNKVNTTSSFTEIIWGDGTVTPIFPSDKPKCGFFDELCPKNVSESKTLLIALATTLPMLVVLLVLYTMYRWWRWERDLKNMSWKINPADLDYTFSRRAYSASLGRSTAQTYSLSFGSHSSSDAVTTRSGLTPGPRDQGSLHRNQIFTLIARYNGQIVAVKKSLRKKLTLDREFLLEMKHMIEMKHGNLTNFIGVCTAPEKICSVWEYCNKGSLQDVIENDDIRLDTMFKMSMAVDICQGLDYIHKSPLKCHGNLRSSNCVIDSRWVCKLTDFGIRRLKVHQDFTEVGEHAFYAKLFWTAPELLRKILNKETCPRTHQADVYALGVIIKELLCRNEPYSAYPHMTPKAIIMNVAFPENEDDIFRPGMHQCELEEDFRRRNMEYLVQRCWAEVPDQRPLVKAVLRTINKLNPYKKSSVVDNMIAMMEKYTNNLEDIVAERTEQLQEEKRKTDALLYRMLPQKVAEDLKFGRAVQAEAFDHVTIYFSDIVHFTALASESTPLQIVDLLNALYTLFDDTISYYDVYKVETIGDAYMVVSGLPERNGENHVKEIAGMALDLLHNVKSFKIPHNHSRQLQIRIGLHTGSVVAGVVGLTMPRYCLFGDAVNTASRMESNGKPLAIHMSSMTKEALMQFSNFTIEERGAIPIKGKGLMTTYWLTGTHCPGEQMARRPFHKLTNRKLLDDEATTDEASYTGTDNSANTLQVNDDGQEAKISVADSGIVSDKCPEDKDIIEIESESETNINSKDMSMISEELYTPDDDKRNYQLSKTRHTSVGGPTLHNTDEAPPGRRTWPKLPTFEDLEMDLLSESDDDVLIDNILNPFMEGERKVSTVNTYLDANGIQPTFNIIAEEVSEKEVDTPKSKSRFKADQYREKEDRKKKKKRRKKSMGKADAVYKDTSFDNKASTPDLMSVPRFMGTLDITYMPDNLGEVSDDFQMHLTTQNSPKRETRYIKSASNSPLNKTRTDKSAFPPRKTSWFEGNVKL